MSIIEFDDGATVRRRATAEGALVSRQAIELVRPFNEQIGAWQAAAARLAASAQRAHLSGRYHPGVAEALTTLLGYVSEQNARFEAAVMTAPANVASHGRIVDTRRAFLIVSQRLQTAASHPTSRNVSPTGSL